MLLCSCTWLLYKVISLSFCTAQQRAELKALYHIGQQRTWEHLQRFNLKRRIE